MSNDTSESQYFYVADKRYASADFWLDVAKYRHNISRVLAQQSKTRVLLFDRDIYRFLVRLIALGLERHTIVLPPNAQTGTLDDILPEVDYIAGDVLTEHASSIEPDPASDTPSICEDYIKSYPTHGQIVFFTSGSSGKPTAVVKDWKYINRELDVLQAVFPCSRDCIFLSTVSHQHLYGLLFRVLLPLKQGNSIYDTFEYPEHVAKVLTAAKRFVLVTSPAFLSRLVVDNVLEKNSQCFDYVFSSGSMLADNDALNLFSQMGIAATQIYGSTETGGIAYRQVQTQPDVLWSFFPGISCKARSGTKHLDLFSPYVKESPFLLDDLGEVRDAKLLLLGRADRTVKLEAKRVNLTQMESLCQEHEWVEDIKVTPLTQRRKMLGAVVKLSDEGKRYLHTHGAKDVSRELKVHLLTRFELVTLPKKWRYVSEFPYNSQGKLPVTELEKLFV